MIPGSLQAVRSKKQIEKTVRIAPVRMTSQPRGILAYVRRHSKAKKSARKIKMIQFFCLEKQHLKSGTQAPFNYCSKATKEVKKKMR